MKIHVLPILAIALVAGACSKQEPAQDQTSAEVQPQAPTAAPSAKPKVERLEIVDGVVVPFRHVVRSRKSESASGAGGAGTSHVVRIEFQGVDSSQAAVALRKAFARKGYKVAEASNANGVATFVARNEREDRVRYVVTPAGPAMRVALSQPDSKGMVTFFWKDE